MMIRVVNLGDNIAELSLYYTRYEKICCFFSHLMLKIQKARRSHDGI